VGLKGVKFMNEIKSARCPAQYYKRLHAGNSVRGNFKDIDDSVKISEEGKKKLITGHIMAGLLDMLKGRKPRS
jgi:hypothetical protein